MKVLTFTTLFPNREQPNSGVFIRNRMAAFNRHRDAEVRVVAPVPYFPRIPVGGRWRMFARVPRRERSSGLLVFHPRYLVTPKVGMTLYGFSMFLGSFRTIEEIFREWPFDIIDAHYVYPDGFAAILLGRYFRRPVIVTARGSDINLFPTFRMIRHLIRKVLREADHVVSVSHSLAKIMMENDADKTKITVIPNGIDPGSFSPVDRSMARRKLGLSEEGKILLSVGSLLEIKGMHLLLEALAILKSQGRLNFMTYIIGKGPCKEDLENRVSANDLNPHTRLLGEVPNEVLGEWYNAADIFFLGSSSEGYPNVLIEALACGTPVISTEVSGIPEIVRSSALGIITRRSPAAFAKAIEEGFSRDWKREEISDYGQKRTWKTVAAEIYDLFLVQLKCPK